MLQMIHLQSDGGPGRQGNGSALGMGVGSHRGNTAATEPWNKGVRRCMCTERLLGGGSRWRNTLVRLRLDTTDSFMCTIAFMALGVVVGR